VGGNQKLKEKYNAKIIGFQEDKDRIPGIDILVDDQEIWENENFVAKIIHIPGHTLGHICFYFFNNKLVFTGDTLFSLGCGRIFEGTNLQMYESLKKIKEHPKDTKVFCGHEYTLNNSKFCLIHDQNNDNLKNKIKKIKKKVQNNLPTVPSTIKEELECNIFLRSKNVESFSKLRDLKDNF
jgi:hydroxyacylglutathione hydrolase